jgi:hypothetical protein
VKLRRRVLVFTCGIYNWSCDGRGSDSGCIGSCNLCAYRKDEITHDRERGSVSISVIAENQNGPIPTDQLVFERWAAVVSSGV